MEIPQAFKDKMQGLLGPEEYHKLMASYEAPVNKGIRCNTLKCDTDTMRAQTPFETEPVDWCPTGFYIDSEVRPGKNPAYYAGLYYVQEPTAMTSAEALSPEPGDWVLDLCAAPGGKTTQLACKLEGEGLLVANELVSSRAEILVSNLERMGVKNAVILNEFPERLTAKFYEAFDKILVDAPCSGEGMFRKDNGAVEEWTPERVFRCAERQMKILETVDRLLKPGGVMVYSTCTFSPEENEQVIEAFLENGRYAIEPIELAGLDDYGRPEWAPGKTPELAKTLHVMPFHVRGEGHYIARLKKLEACPEDTDLPRLKEKGILKRAGKKDLADYEAFAREYLKVTFDNLHRVGDQLYSLPEGTVARDIDGLKVLRPGLHLGTFKKNRFEPSHTLAMALKPEEFANVYRVSDVDQANTYLKGEPLTGVELKGWTLVCFKDWPLGFGKASQGMIKNHFPKGLRIMKK
ncbi:MAG: RsmF rRNA methyltransferase first C-terminal domain-containing protein [Eubacterium sp.]|nr:RsmF rRNA methyltransferase first C-terminal domain-containing protein [Eubacterium sp.]